MRRLDDVNWWAEHRRSAVHHGAPVCMSLKYIGGEDTRSGLYVEPLCILSGVVEGDTRGGRGRASMSCSAPMSARRLRFYGGVDDMAQRGDQEQGAGGMQAVARKGARRAAVEKGGRRGGAMRKRGRRGERCSAVPVHSSRLQNLIPHYSIGRSLFSYH